ncbi:hypothetical protein H0H92_002794 [Tricholoma furcatifolium]|nr:hypothetical protein H0H92_002794 [Tricholoma furcatifolium]
MAKSKKPTQPLPPALQTRTANKHIRPGVAAGVAPKSRASRAEAQENRNRQAQEKQDQEKKQAEARARAAGIEDQLQDEDMRRDQEANHPPYRTNEVFRPPATSNTERRIPRQGAQSRRPHAIVPDGIDELSSGEDYQPPSNSSEDEHDAEDDIVDDDEEQPVKRGKKSKVRRKDISALRTTADGVGSGIVEKRKALEPSTTPAPKKTKKNNLKGSSFDPKWLVAHREASVKAVAAANELNKDDDSLVKMGGIVDDDDDDKAERDALKTASHMPRERSAIPPSAVKIFPGKTTITKTDLRGGAKKWNLDHLPNSSKTKSKFSNEVVPRAKQKVGTLAPWANLSTKDLQHIIDVVYGKGVYTTEKSDVWHGLVSYRIQTWRNGFTAAADTAIDKYFKDPENYEIFKSSEERQRVVQWWLEYKGEKGEETAPYQFKKCVDSDDGPRRKSGFCQSPFIIETLANAHLQYIYSRPSADDPIEEKPIGAIILSLQAVEHILKQYETDGNKQVDNSREGEFSFNNYGDTWIREEQNGRLVDSYSYRATRYVATIKNFSKKHWKDLLGDANNILLELPKGRGRKSRSSSRTSQDYPSEPECVKEFVIESDSFSSSDEDVEEEIESESAFRRTERWQRQPYQITDANVITNDSTIEEHAYLDDYDDDSAVPLDVVIESTTGDGLRAGYSVDENGSFIRTGSAKDMEAVDEEQGPSEYLTRSPQVMATKKPAPYGGFNMWDID